MTHLCIYFIVWTNYKGEDEFILPKDDVPPIVRPIFGLVESRTHAYGDKEICETTLWLLGRYTVTARPLAAHPLQQGQKC